MSVVAKDQWEWAFPIGAITLFDVNTASADALGQRLKAYDPTIDVRTGSNDPAGYDLVVNATPSGYYAWRERPPSIRSRSDAQLLARIREIHERSKGIYGMSRIHAALEMQGIHVGGKRVARLMREAGLCGVSRRRWIVTTQRQERVRPAPDLVQRYFQADEPNRLWVADATYIPTAAGFLYLAVVFDVFSRRIVGWSMADYLRTELMLAALDMALLQRRSLAVIHHSAQYTSLTFGQRCSKMRVHSSMGTVGDCFDNAMCESFFATLECELLARHRFQTREQAQTAVFEFVEGWYNTSRLHSSIGYLSPNAYERKHRLSQHGLPTVLTMGISYSGAFIN